MGEINDSENPLLPPIIRLPEKVILLLSLPLSQARKCEPDIHICIQWPLMKETFRGFYFQLGTCIQMMSSGEHTENTNTTNMASSTKEIFVLLHFLEIY